MSRIRDIANLFSGSTDAATDAEVTAAIAAHNNATTSVHGITNTSTLATQTYADSAVSTHAAASDPHTGYLKESEFNSAGKNFIINGGMDVWQRGTSLTFAQSWANFPTDRFKFNPRNGAGTGTRYELSVSSETSIVPCQYALKIAMTSSATSKPKLATYLGESQFYYGKTLTLSFYMKASKSISVDVSADLIWANADNYSTPSTISVTTSWQRFSYTFSLSPSGTYNYSTDLWGLIPQWEFPSSDTYDVYISGVQLELGSAATLFSRSGGTMAGEVASCQRYFVSYGKNQGDSVLANALGPTGVTTSTTEAVNTYTFPVKMRAIPTLTFSGTANLRGTAGLIGVTGASLGYATSTQMATVGWTVASGLTAGQWFVIRQASGGDGAIEFSSEL